MHAEIQFKIKSHTDNNGRSLEEKNKNTKIIINEINIISKNYISEFSSLITNNTKQISIIKCDEENLYKLKIELLTKDRNLIFELFRSILNKIDIYLINQQYSAEFDSFSTEYNLHQINIRDNQSGVGVYISGSHMSTQYQITEEIFFGQMTTVHENKFISGYKTLDPISKYIEWYSILEELIQIESRNNAKNQFTKHEIDEITNLIKTSKIKKENKDYIVSHVNDKKRKIKTETILHRVLDNLGIHEIENLRPQKNDETDWPRMCPVTTALCKRIVDARNEAAHEASRNKLGVLYYDLYPLILRVIKLKIR